MIIIVRVIVTIKAACIPHATVLIRVPFWLLQLVPSYRDIILNVNVCRSLSSLLVTLLIFWVAEVVTVNMRLVFVRHRLLCIIRMTIVRNIVRVNVLLNLAHPTEMKQAVNMVPDILPMVAEVLVHIVKLVRRLLMKPDVNMEHTHALMVAAALELAAPLNLQTLVKV